MTGGIGTAAVLVRPESDHHFVKMHDRKSKEERYETIAARGRNDPPEAERIGTFGSRTEKVLDGKEVREGRMVCFEDNFAVEVDKKLASPKTCREKPVQSQIPVATGECKKHALSAAASEYCQHQRSNERT